MAAAFGALFNDNSHRALDETSADLLRKLKCSECDAYFNTGARLPRSLRCGHKICEACLKTLLRRSSDIDCTSCGIKTLLTNGVNVEQLAVEETTLCLVKFFTPRNQTVDLAAIDLPRLLRKIRSVTDRVVPVATPGEEADRQVAALGDSQRAGTPISMTTRFSSTDSIFEQPANLPAAAAAAPIPMPSPSVAVASYDVQSYADVARALDREEGWASAYLGERHESNERWRRYGNWPDAVSRRFDDDALDRFSLGRSLENNGYESWDWIAQQLALPSGRPSGQQGATAHPAASVAEGAAASASASASAGISVERRGRGIFDRFLSSFRSPHRRRSRGGDTVRPSDGSSDGSQDMDMTLKTFVTLVARLTEDQKKIQCHICLQELKEASFFTDEHLTANAVVRLECGHLHHHHCIANLFASQIFKNSIKCPRCQRTFYGPHPAGNAAAGIDPARLRFLRARTAPEGVDLPFMRRDQPMNTSS